MEAGYAGMARMSLYNFSRHRTWLPGPGQECGLGWDRPIKGVVGVWALDCLELFTLSGTWLALGGAVHPG